jgi:hypothetical protein
MRIDAQGGIERLVRQSGPLHLPAEIASGASSAAALGGHRGDHTTAMRPDASSRQRKGEQHVHDLLQIQVVGSKWDWFVLGLDKYGTVWCGTPRPIGATFELDWVQINENITKKK